MTREESIEFDSILRQNFLTALSELKYMGFVSASKTNTFLFRKNIFSKPNYIMRDESDDY